MLIGGEIMGLFSNTKINILKNVADVMLFTGCRKSDYRFVILNTE